MRSSQRIFALAFLLFASVPQWAFGQISGEIDPTFKLSKSWGPDFYEQFCTYSQSLPDGKWMVSGEFSSFSGHKTRNIARLHENGEVDTSFTFTDSFVFLKHVILCQDGSYLATGKNFLSGCDALGTELFRISQGGALLPPVNYQFPPHTTGYVNFVHSLPNGKILFRIDGTICVNTSDGHLDTAFSIVEDVVRNPLIMPDGSFFVIRTDHQLHRHHANGKPDSTFTSPALFGDLNNEYDANNLYLDHKGRILVSGFPFLRLLSTGILDTTFRISVSGSQIIKQDSNWIYTTNLFNNTGFNPVSITRYDQSGRKDSSYAVALSSIYGLKYALKPYGVGWLMLGYCAVNEPYYNFQMIHLDSTGKRLAPQSFDGFDGDIRHIKVQPDGKILVAGDFNFFGQYPISNIARLLPNGQLDTSFHSPFRQGDMVLTVKEPIRNLSLSADGKILLCGLFFNTAATDSQIVIQLNADGSLDNHFILDLGGLTTDTFLTISNAFVGENQKIYVKVDLMYAPGPSGVGGKSIVFRANANGSRDTTFLPRRYLGQRYFNSMHQGNGGSFYLENSTQGYWWDNFEAPPPSQMCNIWSLLKVNADGNSFPSGTLPNNGSQLTDGPSVHRIVELLDGTIMVSHFCFDGLLWFRRFYPDGTFSVLGGSGEIFYYPNKPGIYHGAVLQSADSGFIFSRNGRNLIRMNKSNQEDQNFTDAHFSGGVITDMAIASADHFYVAGTFTSIGDKPINRIARLKLYPPVISSTHQPIEQEESFTLFPNPGSDLLNLRWEESKTMADIRLLDYLGREVVQVCMSGGQAQLPIGHLPKGIYLVQLRTESGLKSEKWVKQ